MKVKLVSINRSITK